MTGENSRLACARCDAEMVTAEIYQTGDEPGPEWVTYECPQCGVRIVHTNAWLPLDHEAAATANTRRRPD